MKYFILIVLTIFYVNYTFSQGLTKNGKETTNSIEFLSKNGAIGSTDGITKNGKIVAAVPLQIGDSYQGGKIFYIFGSSDPGYVAGETHGLIAAVNLLTPGFGVKWSESNVTTGATGNSIGAGLSNTNTIVANDVNAVAAKLCYDLVIDSYDDWYLPSRVELSKLHSVYTQITSGWNNNTYWSSTEESATNAARIRFMDGAYFTGAKTNIYNTAFVAAIRIF